MSKLFSFIGLGCLFSVLVMCQKQEGVGGRATIKGRLYAYDVNSANVKQDSGYIQNHKVYISYGDGNNILAANTNTGINGEFEFNWLQKGNYTVRVFGYCPTCNLQQITDSVKIAITDKKQVVTIKDKELITSFK